MKIFFPFSNQNRALQQYWWHRLAIVLFFISLVLVALIIGGGIFQAKYNNCIKIAVATNVANHEPLAEYGPTLAEQAVCNSQVNAWHVLAIALVLTYFASLLLQFMYFKGFLYIIFGPDRGVSRDRAGQQEIV